MWSCLLLGALLALDQSAPVFFASVPPFRTFVLRVRAAVPPFGEGSCRQRFRMATVVRLSLGPTEAEDPERSRRRVFWAE